jgi:hypothetical protein
MGLESGKNICDQAGVEESWQTNIGDVVDENRVVVLVADSELLKEHLDLLVDCWLRSYRY